MEGGLGLAGAFELQVAVAVGVAVAVAGAGAGQLQAAGCGLCHAAMRPAWWGFESSRVEALHGTLSLGFWALGHLVAARVKPLKPHDTRPQHTSPPAHSPRNIQDKTQPRDSSYRRAHPPLPPCPPPDTPHAPPDKPPARLECQSSTSRFCSAGHVQISWNHRILHMASQIPLPSAGIIRIDFTPVKPCAARPQPLR